MMHTSGEKPSGEPIAIQHQCLHVIWRALIMQMNAPFTYSLSIGACS